MYSKDNSIRSDRNENARILSNLLKGYQSTAFIYVAAKLGLADILHHDPCDSSKLASTLGAHPFSLHRFLRALVVFGLCREENDGQFSLTELGLLLRSDVPGSMRAMAIICGEEYYHAWGGLLHTVMTGKTAFEHVFGMSQWEHRQKNPELSSQFDKDLRQETALIAHSIVKKYDFSIFDTIADIGGGSGALLAAILKASPKSTGILFDKQHVIEEAHEYLAAQGVIERCKLVSGDFFYSVCKRADIYVMKSVIHDWDDEKSSLILANCRAALNSDGRLLLIERIMPKFVIDDPSTILVDIQMITITGGRERSEDEYCELLKAAGFIMTKIIPAIAPFFLIEAIPA